MLSRRNVIENHLKRAEATLQSRTAVLTERQLGEKSRKRDVMFRKAQAEIRQYKRRLKALDKIDAVKADLEKRRVERAEAAKLPKEKKKKKAAPAAAKPRGGGGGGQRKEKKAAAEG
jgi:hypothetical protein